MKNKINNISGDKIAGMESNFNVTPKSRVFRALDVLEQYGLEIPINLLDTSEEAGTEVARECLEISSTIAALRSRQTSILIARLESYREALSLPELSPAERALVGLFFSSQATIMDVEVEAGVFEDFTGLHPDAVSDLKVALFEGVIPSEEDFKP